MRRFAQFAIFLAVFHAFYALLNLYAFTRLGAFFGLDEPLVTLLVIIGTVSFITGYLVEQTLSNGWTKYAYGAAATWMGILVILDALLLVHDILALLVPFEPQPSGAIVVTATLLLSAYALANARTFDVVRHAVSVPGTRPLRVAHISDLHLGPLHRRRYLERVVDTLNELAPDLVLITGDLVDGPGRLPDHLLAPLKRLKAETYATLGNHERYVGLDEVRRLLRETNVRLLRDEHVDTQGLRIVGVDDSDDGRHLEKVLPRAAGTTSKPTLLMFHRPQETRSAARHADVMLSGHTHVGQIFPFTLLVRLQFRYLRGLHRIGDMWLHVSPGTGTWGPPMRLGSRSQVALLTLSSGAE